MYIEYINYVFIFTKMNSTPSIQTIRLNKVYIKFIDVPM